MGTPATDVAPARTHVATRRHLGPSTARLIVLALALAAFGLKIWIAVATFGTNDVTTFMGFAHGVRQHGPVGVYGIDYRAGPHHWLYNHPPLIGYYLQLINLLSDHGIPLRVTLRTASSAADVISAVVTFEVLRRRVSLWRATFSGVAVGASPLLLLISGFHGNTDPMFVMLVVVGAWLLIDRSLSVWGGVALGLAVGIKIVAVVVLPTLAVYLLVHRRKELVAAAAGFVATVAVTWTPALLREWSAVHHNVLGYTGVGNHQLWGVVKLALSTSSPSVASFLTGTGAHLLPLLCALLPALVGWRVPGRVMEGVALSLVATLVFLPAYGVQYLSWAVAAAYLLDAFSATVYNLLGGVMAFQLYQHWADGGWGQVAVARPAQPQTVWLLGIIWATLVAVLVTGVRQVARRPPASQSPGDVEGPAHVLEPRRERGLLGQCE